MQDGKMLLEEISKDKIRVETPSIFSFDDINKALEFSMVKKHKAVVKISD